MRLCGRGRHKICDNGERDDRANSRCPQKKISPERPLPGHFLTICLDCRDDVHHWHVENGGYLSSRLIGHVAPAFAPVARDAVRPSHLCGNVLVSLDAQGSLQFV